MVQSFAFLTRTPITSVGDDLTEFILRAPFSAHLRDTKTNQYILCNEFSKENIGLQSTQDIVGLKPRDVIEHRGLADQPSGYLEAWHRKLQNLLDKTYELSNQILNERVPVFQRDIELTVSGFIRITQTIRSPIFNNNKKIVAIASVDYDFAKQCELFYLFNFYTQYLPPKKAIENFLKFLGIMHYFSEMPTYKEMMTMLLMCRNSSIESVATQLKISKRTIQEYKTQLNRKLQGLNLNQLFIQLRTRNESNFSIWE